ncbi:hypothetical protein [Pandoraea bronchicola]|uniref:Uncharacterized protein n=1 Tax=Pandoraea bronchicola TaxID=2508287 RepID=A0A5E5BYP7_9BURK|nr:hypothetical protein [Pandoraea bronchicola]VVE90694.1 hypothetical protein PBR20603_04681 [Pandoraea bronchicola]
MSEGLRQAALALHAMHPEDRRWAMHSLEADQRDAISALLEELGELGIPRDASLLQSLGEGDKTARVLLTDQDAQVLDAMPDAVAIAMLRNEPARFVELLLNLHPWVWRDAWYAAQPSAALSGTTMGTGGRSSATSVSPELRASMLKHAREACEVLQADGRGMSVRGHGETRTASPSILHGLFGRWKRWRGGLA